MTDQLRPLVSRWNRDDARESAEFAALLADYHLQTEAEKGAPAATAGDLPQKYAAEVEDPHAAFAAELVLIARYAGRAAGCLVITDRHDGRLEIKRLWIDPAHRGRRIATALLDEAHEHAVRSGASAIRLSVWDWRADAIALYRKAGFAETPSCDDRAQLICMVRDV
ncbi:GNAT family N-acetyltransferase [Microbacterium sp. LS_15]|uniref:GNAT family N-acetyltransferase n=1 Tax=Microbacterium sp. LS_15 TaxID=3055790 RepID=UPI0035BF03E7